VAVATSAVTAARASLASAKDRLAQLTGPPTDAQQREVDERVMAAQTDLARARAGSQPDDTDPRAFDMIMLERGLEQDRAQVTTLEADIEAARIRAPFGGVVATVSVRPGDPVDADSPALVLARAGKSIVRVPLNDREAARVAVGQAASIQLDGADQGELSGSVSGFADPERGTERVALLEVAWPSDSPAIGTTVQAVVTVQEKQNVLIVPKGAIRSAGPRRYVEYLENGSQRVTDVQVGLVGEGDAEIVSGLTEGQLVSVRP
jgi:HlyD family secretion protein